MTLAMMILTSLVVWAQQPAAAAQATPTPTTSSGPPSVTEADACDRERESSHRAWARPPRPTAGDYPRRALNLGRSGGAVIRCTIVESGVPDGCFVVREVPPGLGFGEASLRVVQRARLDTEHMNPCALGDTFDVTVPFTIQ